MNLPRGPARNLPLLPAILPPSTISSSTEILHPTPTNVNASSQRVQTPFIGGREGHHGILYRQFLGCRGVGIADSALRYAWMLVVEVEADAGLGLRCGEARKGLDTRKLSQGLPIPLLSVQVITNADT